MKTNESILKELAALYNKKEGARVGDFLCLPHGEFVRFSHDWGESLQTTGASHGFHLGSSYISYSGGLDSGIKRASIKQTNELKAGFVWIWDQGISGADRGVNMQMSFRVFNILPGADLSGLPQIEAHAKQLIRDKADKMTLINGNGNPYTQPLPEILIQSETLNDGFIEHIKERTGLEFVKKAWNYQAQPLKAIQIVKLLTVYSFTQTYYNNSMYRNTLIFTFNTK